MMGRSTFSGLPSGAHQWGQRAKQPLSQRAASTAASSMPGAHQRAGGPGWSLLPSLLKVLASGGRGQRLGGMGQGREMQAVV
jgi:hypothetical protein